MSSLTIPRLSALLVTLLFLAVPSAQAHHDDELLSSDTTDGATAYADLQWLLPDVAYAGHPIHAAYAIVASEDPLELTGHVNVPLTVYLDDQMLWTSDSIHEHDGFHSLVVTPPTTGTLRFVAGEAHVDGGGAHDHGGAATDRVTAAETTETIEGTIEVRAGTPATVPDRLGMATFNNEPDHISIVNNVVHEPFAYLHDLRDGDGRLLNAHWGLPYGGTTHTRYEGPEDYTLDAFLTSSPIDATTYLGHRFGFDPVTAEPSPSMTPVPVQGAVREQMQTCTFDDLTIILDPNSAVDGRPVWQEWSDIRVAVLSSLDNISYAADSASRLHIGAPGLGGFMPADPFKQLTFRAPSAGDHELGFTVGDRECTISYTVVPNPLAYVGTVEEQIHVVNDTAHIVFTPRGHQEDTVIPHYEFDTRVFALGDDTRLVWQGKLHGHAGAVSFQLAGLAPGDYELVTYPSPQDMGTGPVAADDPDGFRYMFTVDPAVSSAPADTDTLAPVPAPALGLVVLALLGGLFVLRRS